MTWFDLILIFVLALSISFAAVRGALREVATVAALAGAGLLALITVEPVLAATGSEGSFFGTIFVSALIVVVFFLALYFGLHLGLKRVALSDTMVRTDRIAGAVFGLVRALVLIGLGFLGYGYYMDESRRPEAVNNAMLLPVAKASASVFEGLGPDLGPEAPLIREDTPDNAASDGYARGDRAGLDEIVTTVTTSDTITDGTQTGQTPAAGSGPEDSIADILVDDDRAEDDVSDE